MNTLVDILTNKTGKQVVGRNGSYVYIYNKQEVEKEIIKEAKAELAILESQFILKEEQQKIKDYILLALSCMRASVIINNNIEIAFDADEDSQLRMTRAIIALSDNEFIKWKLYNNEIADITKETLSKALKRAGELQTQLWFCKNKEDVDTVVSCDSIWRDSFILKK